MQIIEQISFHQSLNEGDKNYFENMSSTTAPWAIFFTENSRTVIFGEMVTNTFRLDTLGMDLVTFDQNR